MLPIIISALVFLLVCLVIASVTRPRLSEIHERVDDYLLTEPVRVSERQQATLPSFTDRVIIPPLRALGAIIRANTPVGMLEKIRTKLDCAGNPDNYSVVEYCGTKLLSIALIIPAGILGFRLVDMPGFMHWVAVAFTIGVGIWLPDIILQRIIESRQIAIRKVLPDMLDLLVVSVEAGVGFDGAIQKVVEKSSGPLCDELARVLEQVRLGRSRAEALREMGQRTQVADLISFVAAITQAESLGTSLVKVLRTQSDTARERRSQRAREMAAKLPVKLLFPLVFFIFPALFVVILGPGIIRFIELFKVLGK